MRGVVAGAVAVPTAAVEVVRVRCATCVFRTAPYPEPPCEGCWSVEGNPNWRQEGEEASWGGK